MTPETAQFLQKASLVVGGALIGGSLTYLITRDILKKKYRSIADEEIASVKEMMEKHFEHIENDKKALKHRVALLEDGTGLFDKDYSDIVEELYKDVPEELKQAEDPEPDPEENIVRNVFDDDWNGPIPKLDESQGLPFLITFEEFNEDRPEFDKITLTYYAEDDTLVDDREAIIPDVYGTIGPEALDFFGWKSKDPSVVHIRNEKLSADFELVRDDRSYNEVVLGIENEGDPPDPIKYKRMRMNE